MQTETTAPAVLSRQDVEAASVRRADDNDYTVAQTHEQPVEAGTTVAPVTMAQSTDDNIPREGITAYFRDVVDATGVVPVQSIHEEEERHRQRQKRWFWGGAVVCVIMALLIVVIPLATMDRTSVVVVITEAPSLAPSAAPSTAPTEEPVSAELKFVMEFIQELEEAVVWNAPEQDWSKNRSSPQFQACQWISETENTTNMIINDNRNDRLLQRYSLATFYMATNLDKNGWSNNNVNGASQSDRNDGGWKECHHNAPQGCPGKAWLSEEDECDWGFLSCENGSVTTLMMSHQGNNLRGTLPPQVSLLSDLSVFSIPNNQVEGGNDDMINTNNNTNLSQSLHSFDQAVYGLSSLQVVNLHSNRFSGTIPSRFWGTNPRLQKVFLSENQFTGTLPEEIVMALLLDELRLEENLLTGTIATIICDQEALDEISVDCLVECDCCDTAYNESCGGERYY